MVGIDASGLELRMLAHHMQDQSYVDSVVHGKRKMRLMYPLTRRRRAFGLAIKPKRSSTHFSAERALKRLERLLAEAVKDRKVLIDNFLSSTPALLALRAKVARMAAKGLLPGLDGRRLYIRQEHKALNTLLQGAGAIVMKKALVIFKELLTVNQIPHKMLLNVHDEWQLEVPKQFGEIVGELGVSAIQAAGVALGCGVLWMGVQGR